MSEDAHPFNDQQMAAYIRDSHMAVKADYPAQFHRAIYDEIESVLETEGNPGDNILPRVPLLQDILDHPAVVGALTSILRAGLLSLPAPPLPLQPAGQRGPNAAQGQYDPAPASHPLGDGDVLSPGRYRRDGSHGCRAGEPLQQHRSWPCR